MLMFPPNYQYTNNLCFPDKTKQKKNMIVKSLLHNQSHLNPPIK